MAAHAGELGAQHHNNRGNGPDFPQFSRHFAHFITRIDRTLAFFTRLGAQFGEAATAAINGTLAASLEKARFIVERFCIS